MMEIDPTSYNQPPVHYSSQSTPHEEPPIIEMTSRLGLIGKLVTWELDPKRSCCCPALFKSWTIFVIKKAFVVLDFVGIGGVCYRFAFPFLDKTLGIKIYNLASAKGFQADWDHFTHHKVHCYQLNNEEWASLNTSEIRTQVPPDHRAGWPSITLNYIKEVLANPEFQKDPQAFMQEWKEKRGTKEILLVGPDSALKFFNRELPDLKIQHFDPNDRASLEAMISLRAKAEVFAQEVWNEK
jgi:hypothetical protein